MNRLRGVTSPALASGASGREDVQKYDIASYRVKGIECEASMDRYIGLMKEAYEPLGFWSDEVLPSPGSRCFEVQYLGRTAAIFRLSPVAEESNPFISLLPEALTCRRKVLEVNNVVVRPEFRATIVLGLILLHSARMAFEGNFDCVAGTTRLQTLRYFVDFGVVPIYHAPLHVLGRDELQDFVIYYDTRSHESQSYMEERARRFFHQQFVMKRISDAYGRTRRKASAQIVEEYDAMLESG